jgi:anthranilate phosphoribosyltransferase
MSISSLLEKLIRRENLSVEEAADAMGAIMSGDATPAQIAALLVGLTMKGERPAEIVGLAQAMRAHAVPLTRTFDDAFDTCGTGGDRSGTFNISSGAARGAAGARRRGGPAIDRSRASAGAPMSTRPSASISPPIRWWSRSRSKQSASRSSSRRRFIRRCAMPHQ